MSAVSDVLNAYAARIEVRTTLGTFTIDGPFEEGAGPESAVTRFLRTSLSVYDASGNEVYRKSSQHGEPAVNLGPLVGIAAIVGILYVISRAL